VRVRVIGGGGFQIQIQVSKHKCVKACVNVNACGIQAMETQKTEIPHKQWKSKTIYQQHTKAKKTNQRNQKSGSINTQNYKQVKCDMDTYHRVDFPVFVCAVCIGVVGVSG